MLSTFLSNGTPLCHVLGDAQIVSESMPGNLGAAALRGSMAMDMDSL